MWELPLTILIIVIGVLIHQAREETLAQAKHEAYAAKSIFEVEIRNQQKDLRAFREETVEALALTHQGIDLVNKRIKEMEPYIARIDALTVRAGFKL
jgi:hypothetical protein